MRWVPALHLRRPPTGPAPRRSDRPTGPAPHLQRPPTGPAPHLQSPPTGPAPHLQSPPTGPAPHLQRPPTGPAPRRSDRPTGPAPHLQRPPTGPAPHLQSPPTGPAPHLQRPPTGPAPHLQRPPTAPPLAAAARRNAGLLRVRLPGSQPRIWSDRSRRPHVTPSVSPTGPAPARSPRAPASCACLRLRTNDKPKRSFASPEDPGCGPPPQPPSGPRAPFPRCHRALPSLRLAPCRMGAPWDPLCGLWRDALCLRLSFRTRSCWPRLLFIQRVLTSRRPCGEQGNKQRCFPGDPDCKAPGQVPRPHLSSPSAPQLLRPPSWEPPERAAHRASDPQRQPVHLYLDAFSLGRVP
ncbi:basic proline-rich protein-like [Mustela erminea]|uniref:basic proline-rich protein-like n=1 Tax=Mustela erminea TaxID=36723 RepID=UPI00138704D7|nr:basic proline-rich protein-like [Mustela erminea]